MSSIQELILELENEFHSDENNLSESFVVEIREALKELDEWRKVPSYYGIMTQSHQPFVLAMDKRGEYVEKQLQELLEQARDLNKRLDNIVAHR